MKRRTNLLNKRQACDKMSVTDRTMRTEIIHDDRCKDVEDLLPIPRLGFFSSSILVALFSLICYWSSVRGDFVFDDSEAIVNNEDVTGDASVSAIFSHDFWGGDISSNLSHKSYRPLTTLTFKLNYYFAEGLHPWGFHFVNIAVHTMVCVLFLFVFDIIFGTVDGHYDISFKMKSPRASLLTSLYFTSHPVHTESVCGIVGRAELLSGLLFALSFLFYAEACKQGTRLGTFGKMMITLTASMLLAAVAMLFKEQGITVLGLCCIYDAVLVFGDLWPNETIKTSNDKEKYGTKIRAIFEHHAFKPFMYRQIFVASCGVLMLLGRFQVMGGTSPKFKPIDNPASFEDSSIFRTINYNYIYSLNMWLLIFPWWLCFDWSMGCIPVIKSLSDIRILAPLFMWVTFSCIFSCCLRSSNRSIYLIGVSLLVVPFLPASNLFFQVGFVIAERVLFLSAGGYCVLLILGLAYASKNLNRKITCILTYAYLGFFMWRSVNRSIEWVTEETLFISGENVCPLNAKVHYNIGKVKTDVNISKALKHYKEAIRLYPEYDQAYNNLGNLLQSIGDSSGAEKALEKALTIRPTFAASWMNLGIAKTSLKKYQEAEKCYLNALKHRKKYTDAHYNLGNLYVEWRKNEKALEEYQKSLRLDPLKENAWNNYVLLLENTGQLEKAALSSKQALGLLPYNAALHFALGNILGKMEKFKESEGHFLHAIQLNSANSNFYGNLGVLYHRWGKIAKAEKFYMEALRLNPHNDMVQINFKKLRRKTSRHGN